MKHRPFLVVYAVVIMRVIAILHTIKEIVKLGLIETAILVISIFRCSIHYGFQMKLGLLLITGDVQPILGGEFQNDKEEIASLFEIARWFQANFVASGGPERDSFRAIF